MNRETRETHAARFGAWVKESAIITLPVGTADALWDPTARSPVKVVSIGRLVRFKAYNNAAPSIVRTLCNKGLSVVWAIYGTGPDAGKINEKIVEHNVAEKVHLHGQAPYKHFQDIVLQHDLFVGMGTAAVEAALVGVPTIVATIDMPNGSHGFLDEVPAGNVGEFVHTLPVRQIDELIEEYCALSVEDRVLLSARMVSASKPYSLRSFFEAVDSQFPLHGKPPIGITGVLWARLFLSLMDGWLSGIIYGRGIVSGVKKTLSFLKRNRAQSGSRVKAHRD